MSLAPDLPDAPDAEPQRSAESGVAWPERRALIDHMGMLGAALAGYRAKVAATEKAWPVNIALDPVVEVIQEALNLVAELERFRTRPKPRGVHVTDRQRLEESLARYNGMGEGQSPLWRRLGG